MTHTPGPWMVKPEKYHLAGAWPQVIAEGKHGNGNWLIANLPSERYSTETTANARLIAAAPALLEALEEALVHIEGSSFIDTSKWRAAIAQAKGE